MRQVKFYTLLLFISFSLGQSVFGQGSVVSYRLKNTYTMAALEGLLNSLNIPSAIISPKFEVDVYKVIYETTNASNTGLTTASGIIAVPRNVSCAMPLVSYQHGTTSLRRDVPSYGSMEAELGVVLTSAVGYISALPDYLGLGDSPGMHPYIHARSEATAAVDLLRATRILKDSIGYNLNEQLFVLGYSQGGHATMALHKYIQEHLAGEFEVTASVPMSGPYDVSGAQSMGLFNNGVYETPGYLPYVILGYQEAYGNIYQDLSEIFVAPYDTMVERLFNGFNSLSSSNNLLPRNVVQMLQPAFYNDFINNPNNVMRIALRDNDVYDWVPRAPTYLLYCNGDEQVYAENSLVAYQTMTANGATNVIKKDWGNRTHTGCLMYALIDAYLFLNNHKDVSNGLEVNFTTTANNNGLNISANVSGGSGVYYYNWSGMNSTNNNIQIQNTGSYFVNVMDSRGCYTAANININNLTGVENFIEEKGGFKVYPNPAKDFLIVEKTIDSESEYKLKISNILGQTIMEEHKVFENKIVLNADRLKAGIYFIEIKYGLKSEIFKIIIED